MSDQVSVEKLSLLKVGELAKRTGKTVRAVHLYEELGLLSPAARIEWISKLQALGFSLTEIKVFLRDWEQGETAPKAMAHMREIFSDKLRETRETIAQLTQLVTDLQETLSYMESCRSCEPGHVQHECGTCDIHGHEGKAPLLVDGISKA